MAAYRETDSLAAGWGFEPSVSLAWPREPSPTRAALIDTSWTEDYHLFILGALSFASAWLGRTAIHRGWRGRFRHLIAMGLSYILLLVAFYVDNGKRLPLWKDLPAFTYWLLPFAGGMPIIAWALLRHPVVSRDSEVLH
jgi:hypothetical protein